MYDASPMARTNIDIDEALIERVMQRYGVATKKEAVHLALRRAVGEPSTRTELLELQGMGWEGSLDDLRRDRTLEGD